MNPLGEILSIRQQPNGTRRAEWSDECGDAEQRFAIGFTIHHGECVVVTHLFSRTIQSQVDEVNQWMRPIQHCD